VCMHVDASSRPRLSGKDRGGHLHCIDCVVRSSPVSGLCLHTSSDLCGVPRVPGLCVPGHSPFAGGTRGVLKHRSLRWHCGCDFRQHHHWVPCRSTSSSRTTRCYRWPPRCPRGGHSYYIRDKAHLVGIKGFVWGPYRDHRRCVRSSVRPMAISTMKCS